MHNVWAVSTAIDQPLAISPPTRAQAVAQHLRDLIHNGGLAPGARLRQNQIATQLGVSSTPVREAFGLLEREGLVVARSHRGVVVFNPTLEEFQEVYEIRIPLECALLAKAIPNYVEADLRAMREALDDMAAMEDLRSGPLLNERFHALLYAPARRPRLERLVRTLRDECLVYMRRLAPVWPDFGATQAQHEAIFAACRERDIDRAVAALKVHLEHSVQVLDDHLHATKG